jgi:hypothetical protein
MVRLVRLSSTTAMMLVALMLTACGSGSKSASATTTRTSSASTSSTTAPGATGAPVATTTTAGSSDLSAPDVVTGSAGGVTATMHLGGHHPIVNHAWPISFIVSASGAPARANVNYEYLFGGQVVARRSPAAGPSNTFTGHFSDFFLWPAAAVGYPLTFRAVIVSGKATLNLDYAVQVVR